MLAEDGLQTHLGTKYTPQALLAHCKKQPRVWDADYNTVLDERSGLCMLECKGCNELFSIANPSGTTGPHSSRCRGGGQFPPMTTGW